MPSLGTCVAFRLSLLAPSCQVPSIRSFLVLQASDQPLFVIFRPAGGTRPPGRVSRTESCPPALDVSSVLTHV